MTVLNISNLTIDFGGFVAINNVNFSLEDGEKHEDCIKRRKKILKRIRFQGNGTNQLDRVAKCQFFYTGKNLSSKFYHKNA